MEVRAKARFIRMSPRKLRLLADLVRGLSLPQALAQLSFSRRAAARPLLKAIKSAEANARHNFNLPSEKLTVKSALVDSGPTIKRFHPRAFGRAAPIRKRTAHLIVVLTDEKIELKRKPKNS